MATGPANDPYEELRRYMRRHERAKAIVNQRPDEVVAAVRALGDKVNLSEIARISGYSREHVARLREGRTTGVQKLD